MGGTYDPETGEIVWEMHVPLEEQLAFYRSHPPAALGALRATAIDLPGYVFDGHGEPVNAIFEVACPCGSRRFSAVGWMVEGEPPEPPITLECAGCEAEHLVFDADRHGYDAVTAVRREPTEPTGSPEELFWDDLEPPYEVIVRFELPSDHLGQAEWAGREPELFSWITILARSPTGEPTMLFEYECA